MNEIVFKINHTMPNTNEYNDFLKELFGDNLGENSQIMPPIAGAAFDNMKIGNNVFINSNSLLMARGGITIEDNVMLAANVQLLSNNHDEYDSKFCSVNLSILKRELGLVLVQAVFLESQSANMQLLEPEQSLQKRLVTMKLPLEFQQKSLKHWIRTNL